MNRRLRQSRANMKGRYTLSRQKACKQCSTAKAKCEREAGRCRRCDQRGLACSYLQNSSSPSSPTCNSSSSYLMIHDDPLTPQISSLEPVHAIVEHHGPSTGGDLSFTGDDGASTVPTVSSYGIYTPATVASTTLASSLARQSRHEGHKAASQAEVLDFRNLDLICTINVDEMASRWINPYIPVPGQKVKNYPANIKRFIHKILESYASMAVRGHNIPPFVHSCQIERNSAKPPFSTCLSLIRICEKLLPGSETVAADVFQREMKSIYEHHESSGDFTSLSTLQSYLIYSLVEHFKLGDTENQNVRSDFINLQDLACSSSRKGIVCAAEQQHARPRWEDWIVAEAKRRALYTINLLDSIISAQEGLPTFYGFELQGLPAPASKTLWEAKTRQEWEAAYNVHLAEWPGGGLRIDELWPDPPELNDQELAYRRTRVDHWLEDIDEFGTMIYAISSSTHHS